MNIDLTGKNVLVTGASRGIGAAIARCMGNAGARVALHYRRERDAAAALAHEIGRGAESFAADLQSPSECQRLWGAVLQRFGHVDVLVNNAGIALSSPLDQSLEDWLEQWDETLAVNLRAVALLCRLAVAHLKERGGGRIINISSRAAFRGDQPDYLAYAASKGGLVALTRSIARYFGKAGITAFNVAPGFTRTEMAQAFFDQYGADYGTSDIALTRLTEPDDIAPTVAFLASGLADHATGSTIDLNAASYVR
jgi:3-oxoacyl-[acyl-carrier protein] reductase